MNKIKSFIKKLFYKKKRLRIPSTERTFTLYSKRNDLMSNSRSYLYSKYRFDIEYIPRYRFDIEYIPRYPIYYIINVLYNVPYSTEYTLLSKINENLEAQKWWD